MTAPPAPRPTTQTTPVNVGTAASTSLRQTEQRRNDAPQTRTDESGSVAVSHNACGDLGPDYRCGTVMGSASLYGPPWTGVDDSDPREAWITQRGAATLYYGMSWAAETASLFAEGNYYAHGSADPANLFVEASYSYTPYSLSIPSISVQNYSDFALGVDLLYETSDFRSFEVERSPLWAHQTATVLGPSAGRDYSVDPIIGPINSFDLWVEVVITVRMVAYRSESIPRLGTFTFLFPSGLSGAEPSWMP